MNPLTNVRNQNKINQRELDLGYTGTKNSWHNKYKDSAWIFIGGLPYDLSEGDILCIFSQYGEIVNINLVRDKATGKSKGFSFICYEDQRSTILAVDNFNGAKVLGRILRVDHVESYRKPKEDGEEDEITKLLRQHGCAPQAPPVPVQAIKKDEPETKTSKKKKVKKEKKKKKKRSSSSESEDDVLQNSSAKGNPSVESHHRAIKQERASRSSSPPQDRSGGKYREKTSSGVRQDVHERARHSGSGRDAHRREVSRRDRERSRSPVQSHRREKESSRSHLHEHSHRNERARSRSRSPDRSRRNGRERSRSRSVERSRSKRQEKSRSRERYSRDKRK